EANVVRPTFARGGVGAFQVGILRRLVDVDKTRQVNAVVPVVAHIQDPATRQFTLNIEAPLLSVGILVINRDTALQLGSRRREGARTACRILQRCIEYAEAGDETGTQEDIILSIAELLAVVKEQPETSANGGLAIPPGIPG